VSALQVQRLRVRRGGRAVLHGLDLVVEAGERVAVLGPNGAGKSTLFEAVAGRLRHDGRVRFDGWEPGRRGLPARARRGLGYVPQQPSAFADLTVRGNLQAALRSPARQAPVQPDELPAALDRWGLTGLADRRAHALSGGERRRLEVARALLLQPRLLLLDEPFAGLDPRGRAALADGLRGDLGSLALVVTDHAAPDLLAFCERCVILVDGRVAWDGPTASFQPGEAAWSRYFGA
jgi:lipopolysaccharide export system ATP-binding protein